MSKIKTRKEQKPKSKLIYVKVFDTSSSNQYLKCFNPFISTDKEYDIPADSLFSDKKYNKFFEITGNLPDNIVDKYWRINSLIQFFLNEFYYIYDSKPYYNRKFSSAETLFNFILQTVYTELSSKTENLPLSAYFDYEREYIDYFYIKDFIDAAKEKLLEKRRCEQLKKVHKLRPDPKSAELEDINNFAKEVFNLSLIKNKYKGGIYYDGQFSFIIEDNLVYCCFAFILIDILLEDKYDNTDAFFDLIDIQQKLTLGIDNTFIRKEVESRISEQRSEAASCKNKEFREHFKQKQKEEFDKNPNLTANAFANSFFNAPSMEIPYAPQNKLNRLIKLAQENNREFKKSKLAKTDQS